MKTNIDSTALYWASCNYLGFRLLGAAVLDIARSGDNAAEVEFWAPRVSRYESGEGYAMAPTPERVRKELREHGAWSDEELADDEANWRRMVWIAAHNIAESEEPDCSEPLA